MLPDVVRGESIINMSQIKHLMDVANEPQRHRRVAGGAIWYKALKNTRPRAECGKRLSSGNGSRHGLIAEIVAKGLEDAKLRLTEYVKYHI